MSPGTVGSRTDVARGVATVWTADGEHRVERDGKRPRPHHG